MLTGDSGGLTYTLIFLPICPPTYLPTYLPTTYLSTYLYTCPPTYLPTYLSMLCPPRPNDQVWRVLADL